MNINNPTTFASPNLTLSTSNSSGTSGALRADDTILVYDTTGPAAVAASAVVGSASTSARRDHVHVGVAPVTSTDEAITRYSGTAGALQNYSSLAPTISDAGIVSLTSGALKWPSTAISSANVNTLDDYEEGTFSPTLLDGSLDSDEGQTYGFQVGHYTKVGNVVFFSLAVDMNGLGTLTTANTANIGGFPFTSQNTSQLDQGNIFGEGSSLNLDGSKVPVGIIRSNTNYAEIRQWAGTSTGSEVVTVAAIGASGIFRITGHYEVAT